jgi:hypothetical protein
VDEAGKRWLMDHAAAVVYPTTYEGFGFVPFEAGELGVACFFAPEATLGELFPPEVALLVPWDAQASADRCAPLLADPAIARDHVAALRAAAAPLTWGRTAKDLLDVYRDAIASPARGAGRLAAEVVEAKSKAREITDEAGYDAYAIALVGPGGALPENMLRPILAVANRRVLRVLVFPPLRGLYRIVRLLTGRKGDRTA